MSIRLSLAALALGGSAALSAQAASICVAPAFRTAGADAAAATPRTPMGSATSESTFGGGTYVDIEVAGVASMPSLLAQG